MFINCRNQSWKIFFAYDYGNASVPLGWPKIFSFGPTPYIS